ncbi:MAG: hypothetical protein ABJA98_29735 [Acidobacteriota bacterium]
MKSGPRWLWWILLGGLTVLPSLFAIRQYQWTGHLFYANAFDEPTYLSYDGARVTASSTHLAEHLVVILHRLGLSGGGINLLLDIVCPMVVVVFLRRLAVVLGFSMLEATVYPFAVIAIPLLFGYTNPYYATLYNANYNSSGLSWVTLPQAYYPPFLRTPEPQLSLCALAIATWIGVRRRSFVVPFAVSPFVYAFVGVPYAFIVLALFLHHRGAVIARNPAVRGAISIALSYLAIAVVLRIAHSVLVAGTQMADYLPSTHLPLVSGTGVAGLLVFAIVRTKLAPSHRMPALVLAVAPLAVVNTQLVAGFFEQPNNLEQNFGVVALAIVCVLALRTLGRGRFQLLASAAVCCALLAAYSSHVFAVNASVWQRERLSDSLLDALRHQPESLVIGDPDLADLFSLVAPGVHFSALARSQALPEAGSGRTSTAQRFENYQCVKRLLRAIQPPVVNPDVFVELDRVFRFLNQDFPLIHLNRPHRLRQYFDPAQEPDNCSSRHLAIFPAVALSDELERVNLPAEVRTPAPQWAYAAQIALSGQTSRKGRPGGRINVRTTLAVTGGCVGVGVLTPDQRTFVSHTEITSSPETTVADLVFEETDQPHWLVLRNCSAAGASTALVGQAQIFRVIGVTVRPLTTSVPAT